MILFRFFKFSGVNKMLLQGMVQSGLNFDKLHLLIERERE